MEQNKKRNVAILGSTGSIGTQALDVITIHPEYFNVSILTAQNHYKLLIEQAREFRPDVVVISNEEHYQKVVVGLEDLPIKVFAGQDALWQVVQMDEADVILTALVGFAGLKPTIKAIEAGKDIALANKETLVVAGSLITKLALEHKVSVMPVDSEHSAIFQCLVGENLNPIEKIYLTASGGPFRGRKTSELRSVSPQQALKHPNWDMGAKITIDSATLMNKGLEVIEAKWLFDLKPSQIDVIVHPQSILHSIVQFEDGSMKAQMGVPDMKLPIQYALGFPKRLQNSFPRFNFVDYPQLTFEQADRDTFKNLDLAYTALHRKGNSACILNAANEISVELFLKEKINFLQIAELNAEAMENVPFIPDPSLEELYETDAVSRNWVMEKAQNLLNII